MKELHIFWQRGLRRRYASARLLEFRVRIPSGLWRSDCCERCVLCGRGLCDGPVTHPEESYRLWCGCVWSTKLINEASSTQLLRCLAVKTDYSRVHSWMGARGSAAGWGTALQVGRSRVRFPMVSLEFFINIILPAALWSWGWLSL